MKFTYIIAILLLLAGKSSFAHKNIYRSFESGKITGGITTGFQEYEEINKVKIMTELANKLATELKYDKPIFLYFNHAYTDSINKSLYFVNYGQGPFSIEDADQYDSPKVYGLSIKFLAKEYDLVKCLKLLEYAILNAEKVISEQKLIEYRKDYDYDKTTLYSIDTLLLHKVAEEKPSTLIKKISLSKVYALDTELYTNYYWQNNKYHIEKVENKKRITVLTLDNIKYFYNSWGNLLVFDSQNTFYSVSFGNFSYQEVAVSSKQTIEPRNVGYNYDYEFEYYPYIIETIGKLRYTITTVGAPVSDKRIIYYSAYDNVLIQDLNKFVLQKK